MAEKKTSPNETVHRKKHFKHSFGGRGRWEIRKKDENFKNILRLKIFYVILIKKKCVGEVFRRIVVILLLKLTLGNGYAVENGDTNVQR